MPEPLPPNVPLVAAMARQLAQPHVRCHVPGHAGRGVAPAEVTHGLPLNHWCHADLTELEGLDELSDPIGCIAQAQAAYAQAVGVAQTWFTTNGSSAGILACLLATGVTAPQGVLVPRNAHRSVISGLIMTGALPVWYTPVWQPMWGCWQGACATDLPAQPAAHIKALLVTHPTYEGLCTDLPALAAYAQQHGLFLMVDEAHGALWPFDIQGLGFPPSGCRQPGVDAVVQSCHKTMGSLTQTAVVHRPHGSKIEATALQQALNMVQTSSPSYPLLASIDAMRAFWGTPQGQTHLAAWWHTLTHLRHRINQLPHWQLLEPQDPAAPPQDASRIVLRHTQCASSHGWALTLEAEFAIPYEALTGPASVYVWGVGLTPADADYWVAVLAELGPRAEALPLNPQGHQLAWLHNQPVVQACSPRQAFFSPNKHQVPALQAVGHTACQTVVHCPPGIPVLVHGEVVAPWHVPFLPEQVWVLTEPVRDALEMTSLNKA
jgi:arginine decarboxylase